MKIVNKIICLLTGHKWKHCKAFEHFHLCMRCFKRENHR